MVVGFAMPTSADVGDGRTNVLVDAQSGPNGPEIVITGVQGQTSVVGPGMPEWMRQCRWEQMSRLDYDIYSAQRLPVGEVPTAEEYVELGLDPDEPWGVVFCSTSDPDVLAYNPGIVFTGVLDAWPITETPPQFILDWIVARAYASVEIPLPTGDSAPYGDSDAPMITQFETWLWIDSGVWQPVSATPPAVFGTTATVTATPYQVIFAGDGERIDCGDNAGAIYNFAVAEDAQSTICGLTYRHSSSVGSYSLATTIKWEVNWVCNQFCGSGSLPDYVMTTSRPVIVAELQAIGTAPGG